MIELIDWNVKWSALSLSEDDSIAKNGVGGLAMNITWTYLQYSNCTQRLHILDMEINVKKITYLKNIIIKCKSFIIQIFSEYAIIVH